MTLEACARTFAQASFAVLRDRCRNYGPTQHPVPEWVKGDGGAFRLAYRTLSRDEACLDGELRTFSETPQGVDTAELDAAIRGDRRLGKYVDQMVGTAFSRSTATPGEIRRSLLLHVVGTGKGFRFTEPRFDRGYAAWLAEWTASVVTMTVISPLPGFHLSSRVEVADGIELDHLTDDEVSAALRMGILQTMPGGFGVLALVADRVAVRRTYALRRVIDPELTEQVLVEEQAKVAAAWASNDDVIQALRVFKRGRIAISGTMQLVGSPGTMQSSGGAMFTTGGGQSRTLRGGMELSRADTRRLKAFWPAFEKARQRPDLGSAVRRFSYAGERTRDDDRIVDLVAALEALLLSDTNDRRELAFRTALRGAVFIEGSDLTRHQILDHLRRAYGVRSTVAHGGTPKAKELTLPDGTRGTLGEFVDTIEDLARLAVRKALAAVATGNDWPPDWDALALREAAYPPR